MKFAFTLTLTFLCAEFLKERGCGETAPQTFDTFRSDVEILHDKTTIAIFLPIGLFFECVMVRS